MTTNFRTSQENFWASEFGNAYIERNQDAAQIAANIAFFVRALHAARQLGDCIEFGANIGLNLRALQTLFPRQNQYGIEINVKAAALLAEAIPAGHIFNTSILEFNPTRTWDLVLIKTVLIHIDPAHLPQVYDALYRAAGRYLLVAEYYNPSPVEVPYRANRDVLFKRDFCGELLDRFPDLQLIDYGFFYHRDPIFPQDDITWFLMEKRLPVFSD